MANKTPAPELVLSAKRSVWRMHDHAGEADKQFQQVRKSVLEAANYECSFCSLQSAKYQEVHHADDDHKNNKPSNLYCACPLCHQVFHIGLAGMRDGADIVYVPELSQSELNQLALVMWLVTETDVGQFKNPQQAALFTRLAGKAKTMEGIFGNRRGTVTLRLRSALENRKDFPPEFIEKVTPAMLSLSLFSNILMSLPDAAYDKRADLLGGLRIFPSASRFRERIKHWNTEASATLPAPVWYKIVPEEAIEAIIIECSAQIEAMIPKVEPAATPPA